jgi:hypothetical protein
MAELEFERLEKATRITSDKGAGIVIAVFEQFGPEAQPYSIYGVLRDRSVQETPLYTILEDQDGKFKPQVSGGSDIELGRYDTAEEAITQCQQHHDTGT